MQAQLSLHLAIFGLRLSVRIRAYNCSNYHSYNDYSYMVVCGEPVYDGLRWIWKCNNLHACVNRLAVLKTESQAPHDGGEGI